VNGNHQFHDGKALMYKEVSIIANHFLYKVYLKMCLIATILALKLQSISKRQNRLDKSWKIRILLDEEVSDKRFESS